MSSISQPPENTAFIKELQWKENKSKDEFLGNLLSDEKISKDHIAVRSSSGSSGSSSNTKIGKTGSSSSDTKYDMHTQLSMNIWKRVNAGYLVPAHPPAAAYKSVYTYDKSQIEEKSFEFHRKRDFYSEYNEAAARFKLVHGNKKPLSRKINHAKEGKDNKLNNSSAQPLPVVEANSEQSMLPPVEIPSVEMPPVETVVITQTVVITETDSNNTNNNNDNGNTINSNSQE